jgi:hypothetical protein
VQHCRGIGSPGDGGADVWCIDPQLFLTKIWSNGHVHILSLRDAMLSATADVFFAEGVSTECMCLRPAGPRLR